MTLRSALEVQGAVPVPIASHFDNRGITRQEDKARGEFNIWFNSFPAEQLPPVGGRITLGAVPFLFPARDDHGHDNLRCGEQCIELPLGRYDWIYLIAASERRSEDPLHLRYADGSLDPEWLRVSDFWPETPAHFGEPDGLHCADMHYPRHVQRAMGPSVWRSRVPVTRETELAAISLPDNPAIHVFALTLVPANPIGASV
ncbi:hypothetical protein ABH935_006430 [Catenulispora sp. GAS73]|uniref:hypothetical protein n=1 Tax=Catenulispora sp. GAS73 TaxID=3156269 RepID=UPI00351243BB